MDVAKELTHTTFLQREYDFKHTSYSEELGIFSIIKNGEMNRTEEIYKSFLADGSGHLSNDPKRNAQYMFVAGITIMTRFAIEGGVIEKDAYNLSDLYIQKMDLCNTIQEIKSLYGEVAHDFATRVHDIRLSKAYSKPILLSIDYIYDHLHYNISVDDIAQAVNLSTSYFSSLFKKEIGISVAAYVRNMRIEAAKNMLLYSEYSYQEISNYLSFSSQSHFISIFKKHVGVTPKEYRMKHFSKSWQE